MHTPPLDLSIWVQLASGLNQPLDDGMPRAGEGMLLVRASGGYVFGDEREDVEARGEVGWVGEGNVGEFSRYVPVFL